ncbi:MAG: LD-carboxypeptidase [Deltaproteobacteria bacterium]|nr:LD-carboxypeptidase [Deltaproteobacteria bacterium]
MANRSTSRAGVAVVAPASPAPRESYREGLRLLEAFAPIVRMYPAEVEARPQGAPFAYLADSDVARAAELNAAIQDPDVQAIFCARGGYGTTRLLDLDGEEAIDWATLKERRIGLVGFSDITALHQAAFHRGIPTVHGPVVNQLASLPEEDITGLFEVIASESLPGLEALRCLRPGRAQGLLTGGNLSVLAALCGTRESPRFAGAVVLLEDVNESPYRLDRALTQLLAAGAFRDVAGIALGDFTRCHAAQGTPPVLTTAQEVLVERLAPLGVPMVAGMPVGHGSRNAALVLGVEVALDADAGTLSYVLG